MFGRTIILESLGVIERVSAIFNIIPEWLLVILALITCLFSSASSSPELLVSCGRILPKIQGFRGSHPGDFLSSVTFMRGRLKKKLTSFLKKADLFLELTSHFQMQYMAINTFLFCSFWVKNSLEAWWLVSLAGIALNLGQIGRWYLPEPELQAKTTVKLRIFQINILYKNKQYARAIARVLEIQPDVAIFMETSTNWSSQLEILQDCFPYCFIIRDSDNYGSGSAIYSKLPLEETSTLVLAGGRKSLVSRITIEGTPLLIIATHLSNPAARKGGFLRRNRQLAKLGDYVAKAKHPVVVAGDFNTTMWSPYYKRFSRQTGLRNARAGFGIMPTWPRSQSAILYSHRPLSG